MPLFDFVCKSCGKDFETLVIGSDKPQCPYCASGDLEKQLSTFAFKTGGASGTFRSTASSGGGCSGCGGGSCSSCH